MKIEPLTIKNLSLINPRDLAILRILDKYENALPKVVCLLHDDLPASTRELEKEFNEPHIITLREVIEESKKTEEYIPVFEEAGDKDGFSNNNLTHINDNSIGSVTTNVIIDTTNTKNQSTNSQIIDIPLDHGSISLPPRLKRYIKEKLSTNFNIAINIPLQSLTGADLLYLYVMGEFNVDKEVAQLYTSGIDSLEEQVNKLPHKLDFRAIIESLPTLSDEQLLSKVETLRSERKFIFDKLNKKKLRSKKKKDKQKVINIVEKRELKQLREGEKEEKIKKVKLSLRERLDKKLAQQTIYQLFFTANIKTMKRYFTVMKEEEFDEVITCFVVENGIEEEEEKKLKNNLIKMNIDQKIGLAVNLLNSLHKV